MYYGMNVSVASPQGGTIVAHTLRLCSGQAVSAGDGFGILSRVPSGDGTIPGIRINSCRFVASSGLVFDLMHSYPGLTSWATVVSPFGLDR